eukprot:1160920-Pelagomonas_calceolata.AAC.8
MAASSSMPASPACTAYPTLPAAASAATSSMLGSSSSSSFSMAQEPWGAPLPLPGAAFWGLIAC